MSVIVFLVLICAMMGSAVLGYQWGKKEGLEKAEQKELEDIADIVEEMTLFSREEALEKLKFAFDKRKKI